MRGYFWSVWFWFKHRLLQRPVPYTRDPEKILSLFKKHNRFDVVVYPQDPPVPFGCYVFRDLEGVIRRQATDVPWPNGAVLLGARVKSINLAGVGLLASEVSRFQDREAIVAFLHKELESHVYRGLQDVQEEFDGSGGLSVEFAWEDERPIRTGWKRRILGP